MGSTTPGPAETDLVGLARAMSLVADRASVGGDAHALEGLVQAAVERVPGAHRASVTVLRGSHFRTEAATDDQALRADALQYELGSGPCVDAAIEDHVFMTGDVTEDHRWCAWGARANAEAGIRSVLAYRLHLHDESGAIAALNVYSDDRDAFDDRALGTGLVLATHGSLLVTAMIAREHADNLLRALESNREIGVAMGILMQRHQLTRDQAFGVLRAASQDTNRKLADVATEVAETGTLSVRGWPGEATAAMVGETAAR
jgi:hypothetical protein